jgi:hypothetical protein
MKASEGARMRTRELATAGVIAALCTVIAVVVVSPSAAAPEVHLTAAGDYGASADTDRVLAEVARRDPDAHLALGDLAYDYSPTPYQWCDYVKQHVGDRFPFQLISGNHESEDNNNGDINDFSACLPNQVAGISGIYGREYVMDFPSNAPLVRVIQASPNLTFEGSRWTYADGDSHWRWVERAIDEGRARGAQWIIVTAHYPCLTVGANGCPSNDDFYDLLVAKRVDLVLHGHEHSYARTHQLATGAPGCPTVAPGTTNQACIVDTDGQFRAGAGTIFATVGTGGIALRNVSGSDSEAGYFAAWSGANSRPSHGLLDLSITADQLSARFVATSGSFSDSFTIDPGAPPPASTTTTAPATSSTTTTAPASSTTTTTTTISTTTTTTTAPPVGLVLAADAFERSVSSGWGTADLGGAWTVSSTSAFQVASGGGRMSNPAGTSRQAHLRSTSATNTDFLVTLSSDKVATGSGLYVSVIPRSIAGGSEYRAVLRTRSDGRYTLRIDRGSTIISPEVVLADVTAGPNRRIDLRVQAIGTNPTTIRTKAWASGTPEPAAWTRSATDATAGMQQAGSVGFSVYLSSSATNGPIATSIHDLVVTAP